MAGLGVNGLILLFCVLCCKFFNNILNVIDHFVVPIVESLKSKLQKREREVESKKQELVSVFNQKTVNL